MPTSEASYDPQALIAQVVQLIPGAEVTKPETALLCAAGLLDALGMTPVIPGDDRSPAAERVREMILEHQTRTTTRSRRSL